MPEKIPLLVICGPTASGKTKLAVDLALEYNGEVVSADSMQVYKELSVITAKVTPEEMRGVRHHLVDFLPLCESFSVAEYVKLAHEAIADIHSRGKLPIVCGGTGLYISSLVKNVQFDESGGSDEIRQRLEEYAEKNGKHALWERLEKIDPEAASNIHENNLIRVIRAIEVYEQTGITLTEQKRRSMRFESPYNACMIQIGFRDRAELYERIDRRVDIMMQNGMLEEARAVYTDSDPATAYQAIGYKELIPYFEGRSGLEECVEKIKQESRRYAKRQLTWFRRMEDINVIYAEKTDEYKIFFENVKKSIAKSKII
ncbi:MAG: tRNA (adenosine(37)-N6)-dimethylallyltransferase MiaA [Oscillospiraceae bacterium]